MFEDLLAGWDGEGVLARHDPSSGAWMFVAVHSTALGPAAGGTRLLPGSSPADAMRDAMRLGAAMTAKNAVAGLPLGGGKGVIAVEGALPTGDARRDLLRTYGRFVASLGGTYRTACDMNTSPEDMDVIAGACPWVFGRTPEAGGSGSSAPATAVGLAHGIRAALKRVFGSPSPRGRTVAIQGVGAVGSVLARILADEGASLVVADTDAARADTVATAVGARRVDPEEILGQECDVLSPCAHGAVLSSESVPRLRCRIVAGAANNQLATPRDGDLLAERGVLYAPDLVVNAGGIVHLASLELLGEDRAALDRRLEGIGASLTAVLHRADDEGITPARAADRIAAERVAAATARR